MERSAAIASMSTLLERVSELEQLDRLVSEACAGRGRLVLVEGPPGIGKSRLLEAARVRARDRGMVVLSARASELDREFPLGVVRQLFEPLVVSADAERRATLLHGAAGLAAPLLGHALPEREAAAPGADQSLAHFHALYWLTANLAEEAPTALVVDDVHSADAVSLRFMEFLLPRLDELPVLVGLAARSPEPGSDRQTLDALATDPLARVLRPAPLSEGAVADRVAGELGDSPEPDFCEACREATGGNPFLLRELLLELVSDGITPSAAHVPLVRQLAPPAVTRAVLLRLARLGDDAMDLARAVAVLGDGTPLRRAAILAALPEARAGELAASLAEAHIFTSGRPLAFAHPILRSAVYVDIEPAERARAHRAAAALLADESAGADAIAVHLLAAEPAADSYVVATLREAAAQALARGAAPTAAACLRRALSEPPPAAERGGLLLELGSAEMLAGEVGAAAEHFAEGTRITSDPRGRAAHAYEQALALQALDRHDEAFRLRERAADEVADADPQLARLLEASLVASARFDLMRLPWARERVERHRGRLTGGTPAEQGLLAMQAHLDAFSADRDEPADALADLAEAALASGKLLARIPGLATPFYCAIDVLDLADRPGPARLALDETLDEARRRGSVLAFAFTSGVRCQLLARQGALVEAEADARACAELSLPQGWFVMAPVTLGYVLEVLIDRGELGDAQELLERSGMAARLPDHDLLFDPVVHARARLRAARGDLAGGRADLAGLRRRGARWNTYSSLVPAVLVAPELADEDGGEDRASAERFLAEAYRWGTPRAIGMALRAAGLVEGGKRGLELLGEAVAVLEASPARLEYARALLDLGAALRRAKRSVAARDPLRRALDVADACGSPPLVERSRHELRAAGGRPRRPRLLGAEALTASERRVATMASEGLSNAEIAQALFITKKTVESHLSNAYRKLGIRSRAGLAAALREEEK
jgi:DNA-binding CsgD family transcriptional regulator